MKNTGVTKFLKKVTANLQTTAVRFPVVFALLACITLFLCMRIENSSSDSIVLMRLVYAGVFGAFFGAAAQFACERFNRSSGCRWMLRGATVALTVLYYFLLTSPDTNDKTIVIRLVVICAALFAFALYAPAAGEPADFGKVTMAHFKAALTALLYGFVLFLGLLAIYYAIDLLLVDLKNTLPAYIAVIVFAFFTPVYYLSLLPDFNAKDETARQRSESAGRFPRFLEVLVSYIAIPLLAVFTAVLAVYLLKILFTFVWPVGQIGPMMLSYSAIGLFVYMLSLCMTNRFCVLFRKLFPIVLIPLVIMQLVSIGIRINAYGVTESRYFMTLFGVFSLASAVYLTLSRAKKPRMIALLAVCFAVLSVLPPVDAFNVSRMSQTVRIESILERNGMLNGDVLSPNANIPNGDKREITSIINYMASMGYLARLPWMPGGYTGGNEIYSSFSKVFGFEPFYGNDLMDGKSSYISAALDLGAALDIKGFETLFRISFNCDTGLAEPAAFSVNGKKYSIQAKNENGDAVFSVLDEAGKPVLEMSADDLLKHIAQSRSGKTNLLPPADLTMEAKGAELRVHLVFENISMEQSKDGAFIHIGGTAFILVAAG